MEKKEVVLTFTVAEWGISQLGRIPRGHQDFGGGSCDL